MLAGGVAGCVHWLPPVYWLDVVKTRMQTAEPGVYHGVWDCYVKTVRYYRMDVRETVYLGNPPHVVH